MAQCSAKDIYKYVKKDTRPAVLLAGDILEDCRACVFLSQWETVIDCFGPTLANIRTMMAMIDDFTEEWAVLYIPQIPILVGFGWDDATFQISK